MSNAHIAAVWEIRIGGKSGARHKLVLQNLADRACEFCGSAWPGVKRICSDTELGPTSVRAALDGLVERGLLEILLYPRGGRGRATVYRVLGAYLKLGDAAPCSACQQRMEEHGAAPGKRAESHRTGDGNPAPRKRRASAPKPIGPVVGNLLEGLSQTHRTGDGFPAGLSTNPPPEGPKTHRTGGDQPSVEPNPQRARARTREAERPPAAPVETPPKHPATVGAQLRAIGVEPLPQLDAIAAAERQAATAALRAELQPPRHPAPGGSPEPARLAAERERPPPDSS
jgi:hypothetical protein